MQAGKLTRRRQFLAVAFIGTVGSAVVAACSSGGAPAPAAPQATTAPAAPTTPPSSTSAPAPTTAAAPTSATTAASPTPAATAATQPGQKVSLDYWTGWNGDDEAQQKKLTIDTFNKQHPNVEVKIQTVFGQYQKVLTAIASGNPPDVVSAVWLTQLSAMAVRNGLTDLTDYFKQSNLKPETYFPNYWDQWQYNGKLWGLAVTTSSSLYCYNAKMVQDAGLDPNKPPQSTADLDLWADKLTVVDSSGNIKRLGFRPGGLWLWGYVFGANFYDDKSQKITANDPKLVEALDWIGSYGKKWGGFKKIQGFESGMGSYAGTTNPFLVGLQASLITGEWMMGYAKRFKPDLVENVRYITVPPPSSGGRKDATTFGGSIFTIPKGVKHPADSWEYIRFIQDPQVGGSFALAIYNLQPVKADLSDPRYTSDPTLMLGLKVQGGENAFGVLPIPVNEFYQQELGKAEEFVLNGQKSAKQALDDVTKSVQAELDRVLKGGAGQ